MNYKVVLFAVAANVVLQLVGCSTAKAQELPRQELPVRVLTVHPFVGEEIDVEEKIRYRLFPFHQNKNFESARFLQRADSSIVLETKLRDGKLAETRYTKQDFLDTRRIIGPYEDKNQKRQIYRSSAEAKGVVATGKLVMVELRDGTVVYGKLLRSDAKEIEIENSNLGKLVISRDKIKEITEVQASGSKEGQYWFPNPHSTRLFFGPTAFQLNKGEGYLQNTYIFLLSANVGITENITVGGGMTLIPGLELGNQLFFLNPKIGGRLGKKTGVSAGVFYANVAGVGGGLNGGIGIGYGVLTHGTPDANLTVGLGLGFANGTVGERPAIMLGGMKRLSKRVALVSENYLFILESDALQNRVYPLASLGLRFMGEKLSADLAGFKLLSERHVPPLPFVSFAFKF